MRATVLIVFSGLIVLALAVRELSQVKAVSSPSVKPALAAAPANDVATTRAATPRLLVGRPAPTVPTEHTLGSAAVPGTYVPRGFAPNFRERIVADLARDIDRKLGKDFPAEKRARIADVQNQFWDVHGPDVDAFATGKISQPEFAQRTRWATTQFEEGMASVLNDGEFEKLFDYPKGSDFFSILYHSPTEQPGMGMENHQQAPNSGSGMRPAGAPDPARVQPPLPPEQRPSKHG